MGTRADNVYVDSGILYLNGNDFRSTELYVEDGGTLALKGTETITGGLTLNAGSTVFFDDAAVTALLDSVATAYQTLKLGAGKTHQITAGVGNGITVATEITTNGNSGNRAVLESATPDTLAEMTLNGGSTLADAVAATDIDSSGGNEVFAPGSVLDNTVNWNNTIATIPESPVCSKVIRRPGGVGLVKGVVEWT
jgi:hypothetical protein